MPKPLTTFFLPAAFVIQIAPAAFAQQSDDINAKIRSEEKTTRRL
ncbi:MAG TPA: hypothetical protein VGC76_07925 [Pyrinomonadaceae bacterium]